MSTTTDQQPTTDDWPTTTDVRKQLEHSTNNRSRSSFIFGNKIYFSLRHLDVNNDRTMNNNNDRPTNNNRRPTTDNTNVRQQLEHTTSKRSRSSFIFGNKIYFSLRLLDVNNNRPTNSNRRPTNNNRRPTNDNRRTSAVGEYEIFYLDLVMLPRSFISCML